MDSIAESFGPFSYREFGNNKVHWIQKIVSVTWFGLGFSFMTATFRSVKFLYNNSMAAMEKRVGKYQSHNGESVATWGVPYNDYVSKGIIGTQRR